MGINMRILNSNGGAMELACANTNGIDIIDIIEPSLINVETLKANFNNLNVRHAYVGGELASSLDKADVYYVNVAKRTYTDAECATPITDKNMACKKEKAKKSDKEKTDPNGNGVLVMKNAFRLISLQEPEMFIVETGLNIHSAASEAFAALPRYYIRQLVVKDARKCGYPMKKQKSFLIGTKRDFDLKWTERNAAPLTNFLERGVDYGELPAYAVNRMNGVTKSRPSVVIDPATDNVVPNITGHYAKDDSTILLKDQGTGMIRPLTSTEISRFFGFPDEYRFVGTDKSKIKQVTDSVGVGFASFLAEDVVKHYFNSCYHHVAA